MTRENQRAKAKGLSASEVSDDPGISSAHRSAPGTRAPEGLGCPSGARPTAFCHRGMVGLPRVRLWPLHRRLLGCGGDRRRTNPTGRYRGAADRRRHRHQAHIGLPHKHLDALARKAKRAPADNAWLQMSATAIKALILAARTKRTEVYCGMLDVLIGLGWADVIERLSARISEASKSNVPPFEGKLGRRGQELLDWLRATPKIR